MTQDEWDEWDASVAEIHGYARVIRLAAVDLRAERWVDELEDEDYESWLAL